jgi:hypothetical protein
MSSKQLYALLKPLVLFTCFIFSNCIHSQQIEYNWQNSKEGWVPSNDPGKECNLLIQNQSMAMRSYSQFPVMRSGTLNKNLGIDASDYNLVTVTLKNPTTTNGIANARLFIYPPSSNIAMCYYNFLVDTSMTEFSTYTISLDSTPTNGLYEGSIARFGLRGPFGVAKSDTIYWKKMVISNTNDSLSGRLEIKNSSVIYPNPSKGYISITSDKSIEQIMIRDISGRIVYQKHLNTTSTQININAFEDNVYFLDCLINNRWEKSKIIVAK